MPIYRKSTSNSSPLNSRIFDLVRPSGGTRRLITADAADCCDDATVNDGTIVCDACGASDDDYV